MSDAPSSRTCEFVYMPAKPHPPRNASSPAVQRLNIPASIPVVTLRSYSRSWRNSRDEQATCPAGAAGMHDKCMAGQRGRGKRPTGDCLAENPMELLGVTFVGLNSENLRKLLLT